MPKSKSKLCYDRRSVCQSLLVLGTHPVTATNFFPSFFNYFYNDLSVSYVTEVIRAYAKNHKNRTAENNNQLIRDLFSQPEIGRRLNIMWPEDLIR
jgi:hypothetical protein